jgi:CBS domain-containing protein
MAEFDVGALPVCEGRRAIGIITDRDIVVRGIAQGANGEAKVRDVMTKAVQTVLDTDDLDEVNTLMSAAQVRRLPVVDSRGEVVGIVALADVARNAKRKKVGSVLEDISESPPGESRTF